MSGDGEGVWRVRMGAGLLSAAPMNDERREAHRREDERERQQLEREAEQRRSDAAERRGELLMRGTEPHSVSDVFARQAFGEARADAAERQRENAAAELLGRPKPTVNKLLRDAKAERVAREAAEAETPATVAELGKVKQQIASFKVWAHGVTGKKPW